MGEAKAARTKNRFYITGGCWFRFPWAEMISPNGPLQRKPQGSLALCLKGDTIHLPTTQGSLRSYFRKDCRCRAVNSVFPQTTRGKQHTSGCCTVTLWNTWSPAQDKMFWRHRTANSWKAERVDRLPWARSLLATNTELQLQALKQQRRLLTIRGKNSLADLLTTLEQKKVQNGVVS